VAAGRRVAEEEDLFGTTSKRSRRHDASCLIKWWNKLCFPTLPLSIRFCTLNVIAYYHETCSCLQEHDSMMQVDQDFMAEASSRTGKGKMIESSNAADVLLIWRLD
jgi:hypothetical protein